MKPKYEIASIQGVTVTVDITLLLDDGDPYFNATEIARHFNKRPNDWLILSDAKKYIEAIEELSGRNTKISNTRISGIYKSLVLTKRGRSDGGTWLHKDLAIAFARWLDPVFAVHMDYFVKQLITNAGDWKRQRLEAKTGFLPLTEAIQDAHDEPQHYHYSNECDLINRIVLGMSSKEFRLKHGVQQVRDALTDEQLALINELQMIDTGLIKINMPYAERKQQLSSYYGRKLVRLGQQAA